MARFRSRVLIREYGRSQHSNKKQALKVLTARIHEKNRCERAAKVAAERKSLVGGGDRI